MTLTKKLYIHIGYPKTATSAIQMGLYQNTTELQQYGYFYPFTGLVGVGKHALANDLQDVPDPLNHSRIQRLFNEIHGTAMNKIIISSERFASFSPQEIATLKTLCAGFEVFIIVYLRRQDEFLQSLWSQKAKSGKQPQSFVNWVNALLAAPDYNLRLVNAELSATRFSPDYQHILQRWAQAFGSDHILVRPFERSQLHANILVDFLQTCGMEDTAWVPDAPQVNITPSLKTTEILRVLGEKVRSSLSEQASRYNSYRTAFSVMRNQADTMGWNKEKPNYITRDLHEHIMAHFEVSNHAVAATYLERDQLFTEPFREKTVSAFSFNQVSGVEIIELMQPAIDKMIRKADKMERGRAPLNRWVKRLVRRFPATRRLFNTAKRALD
ncbi:MAG: hypothetical protein K8L99_15945 [Anaerolineae bacterium]|nr:hypothetical protein [Anaerolineae bacterium]